MHFCLNLLKTGHLTIGDQWEGYAATETHVFDRICMFYTDHRRE